MTNFETSLAEILEVEQLDRAALLNSFEAWDSLVVLSVIALCDEEYRVVLSATEVINAETVKGLIELVSSRAET